MRFFYITLAVAVTLLASTKATPAEQNLTSKTIPKLVARSLATTQADAPAKRNLRKYVDDADSLDSLDSLDVSEERYKGIDVKDFWKLVKTKLKVVPVKVSNLDAKMQEKMLQIWAQQKMSKGVFAKRLGMKGIDDKSNKNYPFFKKYSARFA